MPLTVITVAEATGNTWGIPSMAVERATLHLPASTRGAPTPLWSSMRRWLASDWRFFEDVTTYRARTQPGSAISMWVTGGVDRLYGLLGPGGDDDSGSAALTAVQFEVLTAEPVVGSQSSGYGYRIHPISKRRKFHKGVDFRAKRGTPVYAAGPGVVTVARRRGTYGRLVIISHGMGLETRYAHLHRIEVEEGQFVPAGTLIAKVGSTGRSTGPHLHFEVRRFGEPVDPHWAMGQAEPTLTDSLLAMFSWLQPEPVAL